jgi:hypothetical protein
VAYVGNHGTERSIYVRSLGALESVPVAGTEQGSGPFFSPDGEWLGFVADGKLMKVPVVAGSLRPFAALPSWLAQAGDPTRPSCTPDIYVFTGGLFAISASGGGTPRRLTKPEATQSHLFPEVLPGGREVLFTVWVEGLDQSRIAVLSLDTGKWHTVFEGGWLRATDPTTCSTCAAMPCVHCHSTGTDSWRAGHPCRSRRTSLETLFMPLWE